MNNNLGVFTKNKFDLVVSLGEDCACTSYLRRCNLQHNSYPFDWLTNAPFENRINLVVNDFKNFLNFEDLVLMEKPTEFPSDIHHDYYENKSTDFYHWHDFPADIPLNDSYSFVNEKYQRRIERLYNDIENSQKILFVWLSHSKLHSKEEITEAYKKLSERFAGKEIYQLIIENSTENNLVKLENNHIAIVHQDTISDDKKHHYDQTMGNKTNNLKIIKKIKINTTFWGKIKRFFFIFCKLIIILIPNKKLKNQFKQNLNMFFYHAKL